MKTDPRHLELLKEAIAIKFQEIPKTPSSFALLADDIYRTTGRTIGVSTLKRIYGYVRTQTSPTFSSLSLLCRYVGYADWDAFEAHCATGAPMYETSGFNREDVINTETLAVGLEIRLQWHPKKVCILRKTADPDMFTVVESRNIKLLAGDIIRVRSLTKNLPFEAYDCHRDGELLGSYTSAVTGGLREVIIAE